MVALCVDDDALPLELLKHAVEASPDVHEIAAFEDARDALAWAEQHRVDVAFLDIRLPGMSGLELADRLRARHPKLPVVFCTSFRDYAYDALQLRASGYLIKPIGQEDIQRELDHILGGAAQRPLLRAQCFGSFEVYANGQPLRFRRAKTKELLAYLIDRRGACVTTRELYAHLWEEKTSEKNGINYLHQLASDLRKGLKNVGAQAVFINRTQGYSVDASRIDCDYYRFLDGDASAIRRFTGEYMSNYSWSEYTCAYLQSRAGIFPII